MQIWHAALTLAELIQLISLSLIYRHNRSKNSVGGLSCDFTVFSLVSAAASASSGLAYRFLETIEKEYRERYPVYPEIHASFTMAMVQLAQTVVTFAIGWQVFYTYRKSVVGDELLSLPCKALLLVLGGAFSWFLSLYFRGRATINELDLADLAWTIGSVAFGAKLVSQVTNNLFLERYAVMHRHFILWQGLSMLLAVVGWWLAGASDVQWHEVSANTTSKFAWYPNIICLALLALQSRRNTHSYMPL